MLQKLHSKRQGFTLVEIMIVVAIIALLAAIAVPNFLRARQRSQATAILEEVKLLEGAKEQWAVETNQKGDADVDFTALKKYLKPGSRLAEASTAEDILGNAMTLGKVNDHIKLNASTISNFSDLFEDDAEASKFWGMHGAAAVEE